MCAEGMLGVPVGRENGRWGLAFVEDESVPADSVEAGGLQLVLKLGSERVVRG